MRLTLRYKLLGYSIALAVVPLAVASRTMIRITQDELKSSANDEISNTAEQLGKDIDVLYEDTWLAPLLLVQNGVESETLGMSEKLALLRSGIQNIGDVVACQISAEGVPKPVLIMKDSFTSRLVARGLDPVQTLTISPTRLAELRAGREDKVFAGDVERIDATDDWLLTIVSPLKHPLGGLKATLTARVDLGRIRRFITTHPFTRRGTITLVDEHGRRLFDRQRTDLSNLDIVSDAKRQIASGSRAITVKPYRRDGQKMLAAFALPSDLNWAVLVEMNEESAYVAVRKMVGSLEVWVLIGLGIAALGGVFVALGISRPVEAIARTAGEVGRGNLDVEVKQPRSHDEIADLAARVNEMIHGLRERDHIRDTFGRYVSPEVAQKILSDPAGLHRGGELRTVTIMFSDLRGFTSLSEQLAPVQMVEILNAYLGRMADIVARHGGTVIEFIGDAIMSLFGAPTAGPDDPLRAVACAAEMQIELVKFNAEYAPQGVPPLQQGVGIATGAVIVGNIGSEKRMKYGVVGDDVNLAARAESFTVGGEVLVAEATRAAVGDAAVFRGPLEVKAKGKKEPLRLYAVVSVNAPYNSEVPIENQEDVEMAEASIRVESFAIAGKVVSATGRPGMFVRLGADGADLKTAEPFDQLENLMLRIHPGDGGAPIESIYAKVRSVTPCDGGYLSRLRFTSIPEAERARFGNLVGGTPR